MKKKLKNFVLLTAVTLLISCSQKGGEEKFKNQNDSLRDIIEGNETAINDFIASFNEVENNLDSVAKKQHVIFLNYNKTSEVKFDHKTRINEEIKAINNLMDENSKKLADLNKRLNASDRKKRLFNETIQILKKQLDQKYSELDELNAKLNSLNLRVNTLQTTNDSLSTINTDQLKTIIDNTKALHTAYYIVGEKKDLEKSKIIDSKGGLLGIGKTAQLNENIDKEYFTQIDYFATTSIAINSKNMKVITTHPKDSYTLEKDGKLINTIKITDPERFWSASKYLVIIVD